jgi:hypothetical protein
MKGNEMGENRHRMTPVGISWHRRENNIKTDLRKAEFLSVE